MKRLHELQSAFKKAVICGEPGDESLIRSTPHFSVNERVGVYADAYFIRISESLEEDFPQVVKKLGRSRALRTFREYLERHPSRYAELAQVGRDFPAFLAARGDTKLGELARLEWERCLSLWTATRPVRPLAELAALPENEQARQSLILQPSLRFYESDSKLLALFSLHGELRELEITGSQRDLLLALRSGLALAGLTDWLKSRPEIAGLSSDWLTHWAAIGLIAGFQTAT